MATTFRRSIPAVFIG